jgi:hypothetical protein
LSVRDPYSARRKITKKTVGDDDAEVRRAGLEDAMPTRPSETEILKTRGKKREGKL